MHLTCVGNLPVSSFCRLVSSSTRRCAGPSHIEWHFEWARSRLSWWCPVRTRDAARV